MFDLNFKKALDGLSLEEFNSNILSANVVVKCLDDMGARPKPVGKYTFINDVLCYYGGKAMVTEDDALGNKWVEPKTFYCSLEGALIGGALIKWPFFLNPVRFRINSQFSKAAFLSDTLDFIDRCMELAYRIDGDKGVSYLRYGLYCLKQLGHEPVGIDAKNFPKEMVSWDIFRQIDR